MYVLSNLRSLIGLAEAEVSHMRTGPCLKVTFGECRQAGGSLLWKLFRCRSVLIHKLITGQISYTGILSPTSARNCALPTGFI